MDIPELSGELKLLQKQLTGDLLTDDSSRLMYATDASAYREIPMAIARPVNSEDIKQLTAFARNNKCSLIPRGAGTSLAGQVVGNGIVVDVSRYMNRILEVDLKNRTVRIQPGVVLDELNLHLRPYGLFFAPETSTSNRCMVGGMVGNNSAGGHSLVYGTTRDHLLAARAILSDGSEVVFETIDRSAFEAKCEGSQLENLIYRNIREILSDKTNQEMIRKEYPDPSIKRRNTGYALDILLDSAPFRNGDTEDTEDVPDFNFCKLIAGSEGTLAFLTEITLNLVPLPPEAKGLICVHCLTVKDAIRANLVALKFNPVAVELADKVVLDCTRENITQQKNRFFIEGDPGAILFVEFARDSMEEIENIHKELEKAMRNKDLAYHFPMVTGEDIDKIWSLRNAGLGVLSNIPGDAKPVPVVEDTSVNVEVLESYIDEFKAILNGYDLDCVYYAHISVGELHLRPVLNLKDPEHVKLFRKVAEDTAHLVKKYRGSLSGEHGDGRLRGEFIPIIIGQHNYDLLRKLKQAWDPEGIFNPGKITDTPAMDESLRYVSGQKVREIETVFDFSAVGGIMRMVEKCNGSGDCRKSALMGGTMCPSFMATRDEHTTTRSRANLLREYITNSKKDNPFDHKELYKALDLCLSCKGCKSECPSNVDMAKMKAEFLQHYYDSNGIPLRTRLIAHISKINALGARLPQVFNFFIRNRLLSGLIKRMLGFSVKRSIPALYKMTFRKWLKKHLPELNAGILTQDKELILFVDEFTNYNDVEIGIKAVRLFNRLGYRIRTLPHLESGRTYLSKGMLRKSRSIAEFNVNLLKDHVSDDVPLVGIEPSAILAFRDEYPELVSRQLIPEANRLARNAFMYDEFLLREFRATGQNGSLFTDDTKQILLHGHCQQKAIASTQPSREILAIPRNYSVSEIPSGCCGMAGSFGYEKEHYDLSMKVGELVLFPEIRESDPSVIIVAPGTSCRHQISDGTGRKALHPLEVLYEALK